MRELVPIIGHRAKLKTNIDQWRIIIQGMTGSSEINVKSNISLIIICLCIMYHDVLMTCIISFYFQLPI